MNANDLKPGDVVLTKVVVEEVDDKMVRVHTNNGHADVSFWLYSYEVDPIQPPQPAGRALKYKVGDEVIHRDCPQLGIGKIIYVNHIGVTYLSEIDAKGDWHFFGDEVHAEYSVDWEFSPLGHHLSRPRGWVHAEEYLLPARRKGR